MPHHAHSIDRWDDATGSNLYEHLAGVNDLLLAQATFAAAVKRWPGAKITLRNGAKHHREDLAGGRLGHPACSGTNLQQECLMARTRCIAPGTHPQCSIACKAPPPPVALIGRRSCARSKAAASPQQGRARRLGARLQRFDVVGKCAKARIHATIKSQIFAAESKRRVAAPRAWHPRLPLRREGRRVADTARSSREARCQPSSSSQTHQGQRAGQRADHARRTTPNPCCRPRKRTGRCCSQAKKPPCRVDPVNVSRHLKRGCTKLGGWRAPRHSSRSQYGRHRGSGSVPASFECERVALADSPRGSASRARDHR